MKTLAAAASAIVLLANAPALAGSLSYSDFSNPAGLSTGGAAAFANGELTLTPAVAMSSGAAYTTNALALGASPSFNTSFTFQIDTVAGKPTANGFAFVLTTDPTGLGTSHNSLGLTGATSLAVEFSTFGNSTQNPSIGGGLYNSNLVAAIQNGNTVVTGNPTASYGSPGPTNCTAKGAGCMNDGDVWTADISYTAGKLYVSLEDGAGGFVSVINGYAVALSNSIYAGFSGSTGGGYESVNLLGWSMTYNAVPEPMTLGVFGMGLAALGLVRSRRRAV
jgi:hypothetical protein